LDAFSSIDAQARDERESTKPNDVLGSDHLQPFKIIRVQTHGLVGLGCLVGAADDATTGAQAKAVDAEKDLSTLLAYLLIDLKKSWWRVRVMLEHTLVQESLFVHEHSYLLRQFQKVEGSSFVGNFQGEATFAS